MIRLLETILQQNYFTFMDNFYQPEKAISMGSPLSNSIAEIFLQHLEHTHLKHLLDTKAINYYIRYVDDILIIHNTDHNSPENMSPDKHDKPEPNIHSHIRGKQHHQFSRPTNNPTQHTGHKHILKTDDRHHYQIHIKVHKMAAYRYLIHRMLTLPLTPTNRAAEWRTIQNIAHNNFPMQLITHLRICNKNQTGRLVKTEIHGPPLHFIVQ